jgi:ribonucleotide reductase beta subunit family protein with ferritin-like domain
MAHDFKQKEPTKSERMIFELAMNQQQMEKAMWSTSTLVITLAMLTKQDPKDIAEMMVNGDEKLKEYSKKVNEAISELEKTKNPAAPEASSEPAPDHDHSHPHTH